MGTNASGAATGPNMNEQHLEDNRIPRYDASHLDVLFIQRSERELNQEICNIGEVSRKFMCFLRHTCSCMYGVVVGGE